MQFNETTKHIQPGLCSGYGLRCRLVLLLLLIGCFLTGGCTPQPSASGVQQGEQTIHRRIAVTNLPLFCAVKTICDQADSPVDEVIYCGALQDADPHTWIPSLKQIRDLQQVDLIVCNGPGAQFSTWFDKVTVDESKLLETTGAMDLEEFVLVKDYQLVHSHGPEGEHSHAWVVPQSWLSPRIARKQATLCFERIVKVYGRSRSLEDGFAELQKKFDHLEAACEQLRESQNEFVVATSSPEVSYLTRELGWSDRYLQLNADSTEAEAEKMLADMRARIAKLDPDADASASQTSEPLFLWAGHATETLAGFVEQQWDAAAEIDLIETPTDGDLDSNSYFERMSQNLKVIRAATE